MSDKTKLVVINERILGYSLDIPGWYGILHASPLKGATEHDGDIKCTTANDVIRLANEADFNEYRVSFKGFKDDPNFEYERG